MKTFIILIAAALIAGCDEVDRSAEPLAVRPDYNSDPYKNPRFKIISQGMFDAGYQSNRREILEITDTKTGRVYIGITGVGITEEHVQSNGKSSSTYEE